MTRYEQMTDDELRELAKQKVKKTGSFKQTALAAQRELYRRYHWETTDDVYSVLDDYVDRSVEDIQYNG